MNDLQIPGWLNDLKRFAPTRPVFLLSGNIRDYFPKQSGDMTVPVSLTEYLRDTLKPMGYNSFLGYDPIDGFRSLEAAQDLAGTGQGITNFPDAVERIRKLMTGVRDQHLVIVVDYASRVVTNPERLGPAELRNFTIIEKVSHEVTPHRVEGRQGDRPLCNLLILLLQKENDVPWWLTYNNPGVRSLVIPKPHPGIRKTMATTFLNIVPGGRDLQGAGREQAIRGFVSLTEGMLLRDMQAIGWLARNEDIGADRLEEAVRRYKIGVREDPWQYIQQQVSKEGRRVLDRHIKGQEHVKQKVLETLQRSALGLSGMHLGRNIDRPKGVFFFAGPTGVGKTQTAKAIAELVFGDPGAMVRFDMSEFSEPHTNQRMIGAPPGYVGYESGGELTNAIRENPFTLLLFDEIEKAHPRILDIFLQILDDGRLTDAKGDTVYFSEAVIVFTTNLGVYREDPATGERTALVQPRDPYSKVRDSILRAVEHHFSFTIGRPELFNRIGRDNVVVFDFIRQEIAASIFDKFLDNFIENVRRLHDIELVLTRDTRQRFLDACTQDLAYGGRGIAQAFETHVIGGLIDRIARAKTLKERRLEI